ncbi:UNVERIFIED_CONTAM: hypothetical protein K2H54_056662 [Gekko kuhli]
MRLHGSIPKQGRLEMVLRPSCPGASRDLDQERPQAPTPTLWPPAEVSTLGNSLGAMGGGSAALKEPAAMKWQEVAGEHPGEKPRARQCEAAADECSGEKLASRQHRATASEWSLSGQSRSSGMGQHPQERERKAEQEPQWRSTRTELSIQERGEEVKPTAPGLDQRQKSQCCSL